MLIQALINVVISLVFLLHKVKRFEQLTCHPKLLPILFHSPKDSSHGPTARLLHRHLPKTIHDNTSTDYMFCFYNAFILVEASAGKINPFCFSKPISFVLIIAITIIIDNHNKNNNNNNYYFFIMDLVYNPSNLSYSICEISLYQVTLFTLV